MPDIEIRVKPNSKKGPIVQPSLTGELLVYVKEPAIENKANQAVIKLVADYYNVSAKNVTIVRGHKSRTKLLRVDNIQS